MQQDQIQEIKHQFLMPSGLIVTGKPSHISTILGSCVAVCLWDEALKLGGINHYMLPLWNGYGLETPKYGNVAIEKLIAKMTSCGSHPKRMIAKIFGGAEVLNLSENTFDIPERNIMIAKEMLARENIPVLAASIGGKQGRKIIFDTTTGKVYQKLLPNRSQSE